MQSLSKLKGRILLLSVVYCLSGILLALDTGIADDYYSAGAEYSSSSLIQYQFLAAGLLIICAGVGFATYGYWDTLLRDPCLYWVGILLHLLCGAAAFTVNVICLVLLLENYDAMNEPEVSDDKYSVYIGGILCVVVSLIVAGILGTSELAWAHRAWRDLTEDDKSQDQRQTVYTREAEEAEHGDIELAIALSIAEPSGVAVTEPGKFNPPPVQGRQEERPPPTAPRAAQAEEGDISVRDQRWTI